MSASQTASENSISAMLETICSYVSVSGGTIGEFADEIPDSKDSFCMELWKNDIIRYLREHDDIADLYYRQTPKWFQEEAVESVTALANKKLARFL